MSFTDKESPQRIRMSDRLDDRVHVANIST